MGAVPIQDAKCARLGKRVMSPTSTKSRAAPDGPMPCGGRKATIGENGTSFTVVNGTAQDITVITRVQRPGQPPVRNLRQIRF